MRKWIRPRGYTDPGNDIENKVNGLSQKWAGTAATTLATDVENKVQGLTKMGWNCRNEAHREPPITNLSKLIRHLSKRPSDYFSRTIHV
jgi:hypothetical protein